MEGSPDVSVTCVDLLLSVFLNPGLMKQLSVHLDSSELHVLF